LSTLLDDQTHDLSSEAAVPNGEIERGGRYTASWLIQRSRADNITDVEVKVLLFGGRSPTDTPSPETAYSAQADMGSKSMIITLGGQGPPALRRGAWVAFVMPVPPLATVPASGTTYPGMEFYRVVGVTENASNPDQLIVETETPIKTYQTVLQQQNGNTVANGAAVVFDNLLEVFDRGTVTPYATNTK